MAKPKLITPQSDAKHIGERIKLGRTALEMTQSAFAEKAGLSRSAVVHYEQGNAVPGGTELMKLAIALNRTPNYLLSGSDGFFKSESLDHTLADDIPEAAIAKTILCLQVLEREIRESVSTLLMTLVKAKLTKRDFAAFVKGIGMVSQSLPQMIPELEKMADKTAKGIMRSETGKTPAKSKTGVQARRARK